MNNTRERSEEIQSVARALLVERAAKLNESVPYRTLVPVLVERTHCHTDTAKRHLAKAMRILRGEHAAQWGGKREGAGRPKQANHAPRE